MFSTLNVWAADKTSHLGHGSGLSVGGGVVGGGGGKSV